MPLAAITSLIAVHQVTGVLSPVFGSLGDRWGYRVMMLAGGMLATGFVSAAVSGLALALLVLGTAGSARIRSCSL